MRREDIKCSEELGGECVQEYGNSTLLVSEHRMDWHADAVNPDDIRQIIEGRFLYRYCKIPTYCKCDCPRGGRGKHELERF